MFDTLKLKQLREYRNSYWNSSQDKIVGWIREISAFLALSINLSDVIIARIAPEPIALWQTAQWEMDGPGRPAGYKNPAVVVV